MAEQKQKSIFDILNAVNVNDKKEQKNKLDYLSWAWAWAEVKKVCPTMTSTVYEDANGCFYHTDGRTCWVKVGVTVDGLEHIEYLPIMDYNNKSIPLERVTSMDANKAIQRATAKACARHGLGLYIYAGEDLPEEITEPEKASQNGPNKSDTEVKGSKVCQKCGQPIKKHGKYTIKQIVEESTKRLGAPTCMPCWIAMVEERRAQAEQNAQEGNV